ncbi:protein of unknown function [Georgfuchsia toluolica]|uniref:Uncharacterized protein n=1 Tax=Georgfuchsia toluolica TaxID=424218 RepID=A0A916J5N4_9PROT|nr:protein of unknown function [Georgfuchsia toluolica]
MPKPDGHSEHCLHAKNMLITILDGTTTSTRRIASNLLLLVLDLAVMLYPHAAGGYFLGRRMTQISYIRILTYLNVLNC